LLAQHHGILDLSSVWFVGLVGTSFMAFVAYALNNGMQDKAAASRKDSGGGIVAGGGLAFGENLAQASSFVTQNWSSLGAFVLTLATLGVHRLRGRNRAKRGQGQGSATPGYDLGEQPAVGGEDYWGDAADVYNPNVRPSFYFEDDRSQCQDTISTHTVPCDDRQERTMAAISARSHAGSSVPGSRRSKYKHN
jgi:hypothetical protein